MTPPNAHVRTLAACLTLSQLAGCSTPSAPTPDDDVFDARLFRDPPRALRPHVRWWWPGGAVDDATIAEQVARLADAGYGGIELQTLAFGLSPADLAADARVRTVGDAAYVEHVRAFLAAARARGLATSLTLGSGWSSGGDLTRAERPLELVFDEVVVSGPAAVDLAVPTPVAPNWSRPSSLLFPIVSGFVGPFELEAVTIAEVLDAVADPEVLGPAVDVTGDVASGRLVTAVGSGTHRITFAFRHRVDHLVAGDAYPEVPSPAHIVDHLSDTSVRAWLARGPGGWLSALEATDGAAPDEVFVDSFELVGELPYSEDFAAAFEAHAGTPLAPLLPFVARRDGESKYQEILTGASEPRAVTADALGTRAREDYEDVRGALFLERFVDTVAADARARGVGLRLQAHGGYAHVLDAYAHADVPESEGLFAQGSPDFLELAASAAHVAGRPIASSESFVAVSPLGPTLSDEETLMLAGRATTAGIQRLVVHGVAYPYAREDGSAWYPFRPDPSAGVITAGPFDITSDLRPFEPGFETLPALNATLARLAYATTRGVDVADVAWLLAEREIPDEGLIRFDTLPPRQGESDESAALRAEGYLYDRISPSMLSASTAESGRLTVGAASYRALVITELHAADPSWLAAMRRALDGGVPVVVLGALPTRARGLRDRVARDAAVATEVAALAPRVRSVGTAAELASMLRAAGVEPTVPVTGGTCDVVGLAVRALPAGHVVVAHSESSAPCTATLDLGGLGAAADRYDATTGRRVARDPSTPTLTLDATRPLVLYVPRGT